MKCPPNKEHTVLYNTPERPLFRGVYPGLHALTRLLLTEGLPVVSTRGRYLLTRTQLLNHLQWDGSDYIYTEP